VQANREPGLTYFGLGEKIARFDRARRALQQLINVLGFLKPASRRQFRGEKCKRSPRSLVRPTFERRGWERERATGPAAGKLRA